MKELDPSGARRALTSHSKNLLRFVDYELVEFFGIVSEWDENFGSNSFTLHRDGLRLLFTVYLDGDVYTSVYRDGLTEAIFTSRLTGCTHARVVERGLHRCLEIGRPGHPTSEVNAAPVWGLRLFIEPHFRVEFIHEVP